MPDNTKGLISKDSYLEVSLPLNLTVDFDEGYKTMERDTGSFITDGIKVGNVIYPGTPENPGPLTVKTVGALSIVFADDDDVEDESNVAMEATVYVKVGEVTSLNTPEGQPSEIDMTHLESEVREFRNGLRDEGSISGEMNFIPDDQGQEILREMQSESTDRSCRITIPPGDGYVGYRWTFNALGRAMPVALGVDEKARQSFTLRVNSAVERETIQAS